MKTKILIALGASLMTIGCTTSGLSGQGNARSISQSAAQTAAQQHPQILQEFGGTANPRVESYVTSVGRKVGAQTGIQGAGAGAYTITTLNSPVMNAFAVPGGYVYITRQLLGLMDDEAELASVLGHEVGHIAADHSAERQQRGQLTQVLAGLGGALLGQVTGSSQLGQLANTVGTGLFLQYSRSQEYEADDLGIRYMAAAGYDPTASASMLASLGAATALDARLQGRDDQRAAPAWAQTHPLSEDRVRRASQRAAQTGMTGRGVRNRDQFLTAIDGLLVGDDPAQGVVEGREFLHPDLRLRFAVPEGYGIQNGARQVTIAGSNGQAIFSGGSFSGDLGSYIGQVFRQLTGAQGQLSVPQPRTTTVNGIPAAYTTARANTQQGAVDVTVFAYKWDSNTAYHFAMLTRAGSRVGPFQSMVGSLSRLTPQQAAAIRPRVIDVVTVRAGDTVQSLANRMAYSDMKLERFLTLNSLQANSTLRAGDKVKIVVYGTRG